jgi:hypothetical protein
MREASASDNVAGDDWFPAIEGVFRHIPGERLALPGIVQTQNAAGGLCPALTPLGVVRCFWFFRNRGSCEPRFFHARMFSLARNDKKAGRFLKRPAFVDVSLRLCPARQMHHQRGRQRDQEDEEEDLRDTGGRTSDAPETERARDNRDDEKYQGPIKHAALLSALLCRAG